MNLRTTGAEKQAQNAAGRIGGYQAATQPIKTRLAANGAAKKGIL